MYILYLFLKILDFSCFYLFFCEGLARQKKNEKRKKGKEGKERKEKKEKKEHQILGL
jgi:hypothetical protein